MKLHLPKQLFTALLAVITLAAPVALTLNSTAWGARSETTTDTGSKVITYDGKGNTDISTDGNTGASDLVIFTMDNAASNGESNNYYSGGDGTFTTNANIQIGGIDSTTPNDSVGLIITNGNGNNTQAYTGTVTGNGLLKKIGPGKSGKIRFEGDVTGYTGNIVLGHSDTANTTFTLQFGKDDGTSAVRGSQDAGVAGTGSITFLNSYNLVVFDYEAKADDNSQTVPVYITNAITVNGGTSRVKLSGGADYTFTKDVTIHELTIDDNSSVITFNGTTNLGKAGTANHLTANITAAGAMTLHGVVTNSGTLTVNEGATLSINSAITNNGTLNLNGAVRTDSVDKFQLAGYQVGENVNGLLSQVSYILATGSGNVSVAETAKMYIGSDSDGMTIASSGTNTVYFNVATDGSTYFVFNDTNMSTVNSAFGSLESGTIHITDGATLNTDNGATISRPTTLVGSGTYDTNGTAMAANLSLGTNWSGTVVLTGGSRNTELPTYITSSLYNQNSKVGLRGFTSWLGHTISASLELLKEENVDYALNLNNGYSGGYQEGFKPVFAGAISGDGSIGYTFNGGSDNAEAIHEFRGNTSGWDGRFINDSNSGMPNMLVKFTSGGQVFSSDGNGGVEDKHSTSRTTVEINSTSATHFYGSLVNVKQLNIKGNTTLYGALGVTDGIAIDSDKTLTLDNGTTTYNGVITGTGNLTKAGEGDVTFGGAIGTENEFFGTLSVGSGSVNLQNTSYLTAMNITGGSATVNNGTIKGLVLTGGSVNLTGNATIGQTGTSMTVGPNKNRTSGIYGYNGTITIGDGETSNTVTTTRVELGDINEANKGGILTVATNATLIITGNSGTASTASGNYGTASFLMGEWGSNSTLNVSGLVLAQNAPLLNGDKQAIININNGGVLAVKGIGRNGGNGVNLTLSDGGKLILGSDGMQSTSTLTSSLNAGTIGIYADTTISKNLTLGSNTTGTKFDTQLYEWSEGGASISQGENGGSLTISGVLSGSGKLVKTGAGTLTLSAVNTYTGTTTIESGILALNLGQVDGENSIYQLNNAVNGNGSLRVESGTTLQNNGNLISSAIILNGGYLTVNGAQKLSADVTMENGSRLTFSNGDAVHYSKGSAIDILVKTGATLDFAGTRQAFTTGSTLTLAGGQVTGTGDGYGAIDMNDYATLTIKATEDSTLDATVRLRDGATINIDVADGKTLDASGVLKNRDTDASKKGSFTKKGTGELVLSATNTYSGGTTIEAGTVTTQNTSALGSGGVTMTGGELKVTDVADTDSDLSLNGMLQMNATASAKLATAGTTLNLGTTGSVKKTNADGSQYVTISSDGATAASMTAKSANAQLIQLAQDASFTIADMTLTNTTITAATAETRVNLNNVSASNLALATGKFTMNAEPVVGLGGTVATFNTGVSSLTAGAATLTLDLDMIGAYESTGAVSGATLTITLGVSGADFSSYTVENWQALVGFEGWLGTMLENQGATYQVADGAAQVAEGNSAPTVSYGYAAGDGGSNVGMLTITINGLNVPEPTTSTLSLLALAALAARRRRK